MKKILFIVLVLAVLISVLVIPAQASSGGVTITITPDATEKELSGEDTVTFTFKVNNNGVAFANMYFDVHVPDGVTIKQGTCGSDIPEGLAFKSFTSNNLSLAGDVDTSKEGEWTALTLECTVSNTNVGEKKIEIKNLSVYKQDNSPVGASYTSTAVKLTHSGEHTWDAGSQTQAPTCTAAGKTHYTCTVTGCDGQKDEDLPAKLGHEWVQSDIDWEANWKSDSPTTNYNVTWHCHRADCEFEMTKETTSVVQEGKNQPAKCETEKHIEYKATANFNGSDTNDPSNSALTNDVTGTLVDEGPALGHKWEAEPTFTWANEDDYNKTSATAVIKCQNTGNCEQKYDSTGLSLDVVISARNVTEKAKCETAGKATVTASASSAAYDIEGEPFTKDNTDVTVPALGHKWADKAVFTWTKTPGDYKATATLACANGENCDLEGGNPQKSVGEVTINKDDSKKPTYEEEGAIVYTATAKFKEDKSDSEGKISKSESATETLDKLEAPKPSTEEVKSPIVPGPDAAKGSITDAAASVIEKALASATADKSLVDEAVWKAINAAGKSDDESSMTVETKLVIDDKVTPAADVAAGVPKGAKFLDIDIQVTVSSTDTDKLEKPVTGYIHQVATPIQFTVDKPEGGPIFYVARYHDNTWEKLDTTVGEKTLTFSSAKFSTFAAVASNDIADAKITVTPEYAYTGSAISPVVKVTINGDAVELKEGTDYELAIEGDPVKPGDYKLTIKGIGAYTGSVEESFTILEPNATPAPTATPVPATATPAPTAAASAAPAATKDPSAAPATGDETPVMLYATMLTVCAAALTLALIFRRRREK